MFPSELPNTQAVLSAARRTLGRLSLGLALLGAAAVSTSSHVAEAADSQGRPVLLVYPVSTTITEIAGLTDRDTGEDVLTSLRNRVTEGYKSFRRFHIEAAGEQFPSAKEALIAGWVLALQGRPEGFDPPPDYAVIPALTYYRFKESTETRTSGNRRTTYPAMEVELEASCIYVDFEQKKVLAVLSAEASGKILVRSSSTREQMVADATFVAARNLANRIVARSRQIEQFRLRPPIDRLAAMSGQIAMGKDFGIEIGDYFFFDDGEGAESGYAIVTEVARNSSSVAVISSPGGEPKTLAEANKRPYERTYGLVMPIRPVFSEPKLDSADGPGPYLGGALELGFTTTKWSQGFPFSSKPNAHFRKFMGFDLTYISGTSEGINGKGGALGFHYGMGYEFYAVPWIGLSVTPYAALAVDVGAYSIKPEGVEDATSDLHFGLPLKLPLGAFVKWHLGSYVTPFIDASYNVQLVGLFTEPNAHTDKNPNWGGLNLRAGFTYRGNIGF